MLPDIRAILAVVVAAVGLLTASFGLVATLRVAQDSRSGSLQADLAQRGRLFVPAGTESPAISPIEKPAALEAIPVQAVEIKDAPDIIEDAPDTVVIAAPLVGPLAVEAPPAEQVAIEQPPAEPPMGGPLPEQVAAVHVDQPSRERADETAAKKKAKQVAAKKARAAPLARQHRDVAKRARVARARAQQQPVRRSSNAQFGNSFGNFGNSNFGSSPFGQ